MDHTVRKQDGGTDSPDNMQLTHPYCNSGYKESMTIKAATPAVLGGFGVKEVAAGTSTY
jgi:hypothetical protein